MHSLLHGLQRDLQLQECLRMSAQSVLPGQSLPFEVRVQTHWMSSPDKRTLHRPIERLPADQEERADRSRAEMLLSLQDLLKGSVHLHNLP